MKRKNFLTFRSSIMKFSQRLRLRTNDGSVSEDKTFPFFIWLLRDVTQSIPTDYSNIKEYFLTRVRQLILKRWTEVTNSENIAKLFVIAAEILIISLFSQTTLLLGKRGTGFGNGRNLLFFYG